MALHADLRAALPGNLRHQGSARARVPAWIDEYNRCRRHSRCGMLSPVDYELTQNRRQVA
ncbi:MAG: hypothetical protein ACRDSM_04815 [Pseudonocardiaceae bacterium]